MEINGKYSPNREIKYRGKSRDEEWVYGYYYNIEKRGFIYDNTGNLFLVDPQTVGQSLGIHYIDEFTDEEGQEVFEGDIVAIVENKFGEGINEVWTIEYDTLEVGYIAYNQLNSNRRIEYEHDRYGFFTDRDTFITIKYLGNRFDNKELLK